MGDKCPNCDELTLNLKGEGSYTCSTCGYSEERQL